MHALKRGKPLLTLNSKWCDIRSKLVNIIHYEEITYNLSTATESGDHE